MNELFTGWLQVQTCSPEISRIQSNDEHRCRLGRDSVLSGRCLLTFRNDVGKHLQDYVASHPKTQQSLQSQREPQI